MATKNTEPTALTGGQYRLVLEAIAKRTATLHQLIMVANDPYDKFVRDVCADAAEALTTSIGAMADEAAVSGILGGANRWFYGPNFKDAGKE